MRADEVKARRSDAAIFAGGDATGAERGRTGRVRQAANVAAGGRRRSTCSGPGESPKEPLKERRDASLRRMALTFCVCGDSVVRVVEVIDQFATALASRLDESTRCLRRCGAHLRGGGARVELNDVATAAASAVRSCIASANILVNDQNLRLMISLWQDSAPARPRAALVRDDAMAASTARRCSSNSAGIIGVVADGDKRALFKPTSNTRTCTLCAFSHDRASGARSAMKGLSVWIAEVVVTGA